MFMQSSLVKQQPLMVGERIVVLGYKHLDTRINKVEYDPSTARWNINVVWPDNETSRVYLNDEGVTWYRYSTTN